MVEAANRRRDNRLNVGSSGRHMDGWISIDLLRDPDGRCLRMDAAQPWPFGAGTVQAVNSEHFLEHLTVDEAGAFLAEAFRVLRPGGVLRTSTPDLRAICQAFLDGDAELLAAHRAHGYRAETHADLVNNYIYVDGHRHLYDEAALRDLLDRYGFVELERVGFSESRHAVLRGIDRHEMGELRHLVLCLDAVRP